ncbi:hypothetical protein BpHYR1_045454 [Brachionus plicatilis]|uniref:Uncharacterized protein n=1 Tax=Brachionus plicatilis TaxID=10195 RepID=A0A3M7T4L7_BRAPC|nr:hypothetical protein BpHYR1_045454 [Brachionus plicatilis]
MWIFVILLVQCLYKRLNYAILRSFTKVMVRKFASKCLRPNKEELNLYKMKNRVIIKSQIL